MIVKEDGLVNQEPVTMEGAQDVLIQVLIGPEDSSNNIAMRRFEVAAKGHTPWHQHSFAHVIKILAGKGALVDEAGKEHPLQTGMSAFVPGNEQHQFKNIGQDPFIFLCIVENQKG